MTLEDESKLRDEALIKGHSVPITKKMSDGKILYGKIDSNGVIQGRICGRRRYRESEDEDNYTNVPWSQHEDR